MEQNNLVFEVEGTIYELIYNFKDAFQKETFEEKLVDVLKNKYCNFGAPFFVVKKRNS